MDPSLRSSPDRINQARPSNNLDPAISVYTAVHAGGGASIPRSKSKANISLLRKENELLRVLKDAGGIANTSVKDFVDSHSKLLEKLSDLGEPSSAPAGSRMDKRTLENVLSSLESSGRIRLLQTSLVTASLTPKMIRVAYLPEIPQETLDEFLSNLGKTVPSYQAVSNYPEIKEKLEYSGRDYQGQSLAIRSLNAQYPFENAGERWSRNEARARQLFALSDEAIHDILLLESQTVAQRYGYLVGRLARARKLHLLTQELLSTSSESSSWILSLDNQIIDPSLYYSEISVADYFSLVPASCCDEELDMLLSSEHGRSTKIKEMPPHLRVKFQVGRAKARSRILDLLEILHNLRLVTPIQRQDALKADHRPDQSLFTGSFQDIPTAIAKHSMSQYWQFTKCAPLYLWVHDEQHPPFLRDASVASPSDSIQFWQDLQDLCLNKPREDIYPASENISSCGPYHFSKSAMTSMKRKSSWNARYVISWHQGQFLRKFIDPNSGNTPLQAPDSGSSQLERLYYITSVPLDAIRRFFINARSQHLKTVDRLRASRNERRRHDRQEGRALLARKAAEAKAQRKEEWEDLILQIHGSRLDNLTPRLSRLRNAFLSDVSGRDRASWESDISTAIKTANSTQTPGSHLGRSPTERQSELHNATIRRLIHDQGQASDVLGRKDTGMRIGDHTVLFTDPLSLDNSVQKPGRRHRFNWTNEYDELARDATVIIKSRCRAHARSDWAAYEQVFPAIPRNSVRQRVARMREDPTMDAYLKRLEDSWHSIWEQYRGTPSLPDSDPFSINNFDLALHIEFLRTRIDKNNM